MCEQKLSEEFFKNFFMRHIFAREKFESSNTLPEKHADTANSCFTSSFLCVFNHLCFFRIVYRIGNDEFRTEIFFFDLALSIKGFHADFCGIDQNIRLGNSSFQSSIVREICNRNFAFEISSCNFFYSMFSIGKEFIFTVENSDFSSAIQSSLAGNSRSCTTSTEKDDFLARNIDTIFTEIVDKANTIGIVPD